MGRTLLTCLAAVLCLGTLAGRGYAEPPAETPPPESSASRDPIEGFNRKIFWFNDHVDMYVLEPVATGWAFVSPKRVRTCISNFFTNLRFPIVALNDLLQGKFIDSASDVGRFGVNTTIGVVGLFDPASHFGLEEHVEDFGQTLGVWGVPPGPYLVLPIIGPSNPRDTLGLGVDYAFSVTPFFVDQYILIGVRVLDAVNYRSLILEEVKDAKEASIDYYSFVRDAYFQRREALVTDGARNAEQEEELYHPDLGGEGAVP